MNMLRVLKFIKERRLTTLERLDDVGFKYIGSNCGYDIYRNDKAEILYDSGLGMVVRSCRL